MATLIDSGLNNRYGIGINLKWCIALLIYKHKCNIRSYFKIIVCYMSKIMLQNHKLLTY